MQKNLKSHECTKKMFRLAVPKFFYLLPTQSTQSNVLNNTNGILPNYSLCLHNAMFESYNAQSNKRHDRSEYHYSHINEWAAPVFTGPPCKLNIR